MPAGEPRRATLAVERHGENVYLMLNHLDRSEPLARFVSAEAPAKFTEALALAKACAHAHGQMGI